MAAIYELINKIDNQTLKEDLLERLDLVQHKIKFMDPVPVCILNSQGYPVVLLSDFLLESGGQYTNDPANAVYLICFEQGKGLSDLMSTVSTILQADWNAVTWNRVCLLADGYQLNNAEDAVNLIEDLAEMLHPGTFIYGYEGDKWIRFSV